MAAADAEQERRQRGPSGVRLEEASPLNFADVLRIEPEVYHKETAYYVVLWSMKIHDSWLVSAADSA